MNNDMIEDTLLDSSTMWRTKLAGERANKRTLADRLGTDMYLSVAKRWVGMFNVEAKDGQTKPAFDGKYYRWLFCSPEHRDYATKESIDEPGSLCEFLSINLMRAELVKRLTAVGVVQAAILSVCLVSATWLLIPKAQSAEQQRYEQTKDLGARITAEPATIGDAR